MAILRVLRASVRFHPWAAIVEYLHHGGLNLLIVIIQARPRDQAPWPCVSQAIVAGCLLGQEFSVKKAASHENAVKGR
jgi:hypothetical protein